MQCPHRAQGTRIDSGDPTAGESMGYPCPAWGAAMWHRSDCRLRQGNIMLGDYERYDNDMLNLDHRAIASRAQVPGGVLSEAEQPA